MLILYYKTYFLNKIVHWWKLFCFTGFIASEANYFIFIKDGSNKSYEYNSAQWLGTTIVHLNKFWDSSESEWNYIFYFIKGFTEDESYM